MFESPSAENHTLIEYKKWCEDHNKKIGNAADLVEFAKNYHKNAENVTKFIKSVIYMRD